MSATQLAPSPIARFLLSLAERGAAGRVEVGGRTLRVSNGRVIDVSAAPGDGDLVAFLRDSGRVAPGPLERCVQKASEEDLALTEVLRRQRLLSDEAITDVTRGLWLDRLVRGMARASAEGREPSPLLADPMPPPDPTSTSLVSLVLDALERRAADEDAGRIGARAGHYLEWLPGPHESKARRWARFHRISEERPPIAALLKTEPAAAPRIAALVRAGLARVVAPGSLPPPPPRRSSIPATSMSPSISRPTPPMDLTPAARAPAPAPAAVRRPTVDLDPGLSPVFADDPDLDIALPPLPEPTAVLDDPLDILERTIASLEQSSAPGRERAKAWAEFAEAWEDRFGSVEEAARGYREAAAADSEHRVALERASDRCASIGQADLSVAYARARVQLEPDGEPRARALFSYALLCRRLGKVSEALGAARSAANDAPDDPEPHALAAHLWHELGRLEDAAQAAAEAASRARTSSPARALSLIALARGLDPTPARSEDYANELASSGLIEAAIAVRADAVRRTRDKDERRLLIMEAAEQAEDADRPVLAAALLTRAFDAEPHLDVLYEPLDADLALAGAQLERAVILEEIAAAAPEETRAHWLARAADARQHLPGDGTWEAELRVRALELNPGDGPSLRALHEQAMALDDDRLLADGLERVLLRGRWPGTATQASMLEELASVSENKLSAPLRAAWAWKRLQAIDPHAGEPSRQLRRLGPALAEHERVVEELEAALRITKAGSGRATVARRLAEHLRDDPDRRRRAVSLYREALDVHLEDGEIADALERVHRLIGDDYHESKTIAHRADHADNRIERVRALSRLASLHVLRRDLREAAIACRRILSESPGHREASIRLRRVASRLHDRDLLREALATEAHASLPPNERARTLTALALELEAAGGVDEAISCAEAALTADPSSAEAALLVVRHIAAVGEPRAALGVVRALFGDAPPILEAWARVARDAGEREVMLEALDAWASIAPYDPEPAAMRLAAFPASAPDDAVAEAIERALDPARLSPSLVRPVASAIERLGERDPERAAALAIKAADACGPHADALRELATRLASATSSRPLRVAALERKVASQVDEPRIETLHELAALHEAAGDRAAESRTHLRVLAVSPHQRRSLDRLESVYAETGEQERLMAVLALELEAATGEERVEPLLKLAAACAQLGDSDRAEGFLRDAWSPAMTDTAPLFTAAAALVRLGRARRAVELLREAGRESDPTRAGAIFVRAVQIALRKTEDPRLALMTAMEGLDHANASGPLLVAFEQLALELKDVAAADRVYRRLMDRAMGPHGKRALAYRKARWLERAGAGRAALAAYVEAFMLSPRGGALYSCIGRLARSQGDLEALVKATIALGESAEHPAIRAAMSRDAAQILEHEIGAPARAFETLASLWEASGEDELDAELGRLVAVLRAKDHAAGDLAFERLIRGLEHHVEEAWMVEAKARIRLRQARLHLQARHDLGAAIIAVESGLRLLEAEAGDADVVAQLNVQLAEWLIAADRSDEARERVLDALRARPGDTEALRLGVQLDVEREMPVGSGRPASFPAPTEDSAPLRLPYPPRMPTPAYGTPQPLGLGSKGSRDDDSLLTYDELGEEAPSEETTAPGGAAFPDRDSDSDTPPRGIATEAAAREADEEAKRAEAERQEAERREARRKDAERQEALRKEAARQDAQRKEAARQEAARQEAERQEAERQETEHKAAEQRATQQKEAARQEAERQEAARQEAERQEALRNEAARQEAERQEAERQEAERQEALRNEAARLEGARQEAARLEGARQEAARQDAQRKEAARQEAARLEGARQEAARQDAQRKEAARREAARQEAERQEALHKEAERQEALHKEAERQEALRKEAERQEALRKEAERQEALRQVAAARAAALEHEPDLAPLLDTDTEPALEGAITSRPPPRDSRPSAPDGTITSRPPPRDSRPSIPSLDPESSARLRESSRFQEFKARRLSSRPARRERITGDFTSTPEQARGTVDERPTDGRTSRVPGLGQVKRSNLPPKKTDEFEAVRAPRPPRLPRRTPSRPSFELILDDGDPSAAAPERADPPNQRSGHRDATPPDAVEVSMAAFAPIGADTAPDGISRPEISGWHAVAPPAARPSEPPSHLAWVQKPIRDDDADAFERRAAADPQHAVELLSKAMGLEPWRLDTARRIVELTARHPENPAGKIARSILSFTGNDPQRYLLDPVDPTRVSDLLRDPAYDANRKLWAALWQHGRPLFRDATAPDVTPNDRVTRVATTATSRAFSEALDALGIVDLPAFYHRRRVASPLTVIRMAKPALVAGGEFAPNEAEMTFQLGRALELSQPENLLVATLPRTLALEVIGAVRAAFAPPDPRRSMDQRAAKVAADLWHTISTGGQNEIRGLLESTERWDDYEGLHTAVLDAGDRAGLLSCRDLSVALRVLFGTVPATEAALIERLEDRRVASLIRFAFERLTR